MSMASVEKVILGEARELFNNPKLKKNELREWSTDDTSMRTRLQDDEVMAQIDSGIWVCVYKIHDLRTPAPAKAKPTKKATRKAK